MHKSLYNEAVVRLSIAPAGPVLIKAGEGASDPARPDMSFVRTTRGGRETVYLPGSSLKGVIRSHCERLARTAQGQGGPELSCDPLGDRGCGRRLERERELTPPEKHRRSCFVCRLFGNTAVAGHFLIADAHPVGECRTEERNGVAIDRVFGSVAVGPFNYETVTGGEFRTELRVKNFTLSQLGLLALALRDLAAERVRLGFAKSRGMGLVTARVEELTLRYPSCELGGDGSLSLLSGARLDGRRFYGVGTLAARGGVEGDYGYRAEDDDDLPEGHDYVTDNWSEVELHAPPHAEGGADWQPLGRRCALKWKAEVVHGRRA